MEAFIYFILSIIFTICYTYIIYLITYHNKFHKLICEFKSQISLNKIVGKKQKLPKQITKEHPFYMEHFNGIDVTDLNIDDNIINEFILNISKFTPKINKKNYKNYIQNINRYNITDKKEKGFLLYFILQYDKPTKFTNILFYRLKLNINNYIYKYKSKFNLYMYNKTKNTKWLL